MTETPAATSKRAGNVVLVGRPNAGKSTLMNRFLGEKVAIVSDKPQTTRHRLMGILTTSMGQMVFLDTPGVHRPLHRMNRQMVEAAREAMAEADVVCVLHDASVPFGQGDQFLLDFVGKSGAPKIAVLNKIDRIDKRALLPRIARFAENGQFDEIVPVSALNGDGCARLLNLLWDRLSPGEARFAPDLVTIQPERYLAAERVREKLLAMTRDEVPFATAVRIDRWEEVGNRSLVRIFASILVDKAGQKAIVIGRKGSRIKAIGSAARRDLEEYLGAKVFLDLHVRVQPGWREDPRILSELERMQEEIDWSDR